MSEPRQTESWDQSRERGAYLGIRILFALYRTIGRAGFRIALAPVIIYFFVFNGKARRSSIAFLRRVHSAGGGAWSKNARPGWRQSIRHFMSFGEAALDKAAAWSGSFNQVPVRYEGREIIEQWHDAKQGAVLLTSHLGNIEACRALSRERTDFRLNVLVHTRHAEKFNRVLQGVDEKVGVRLVEVTDFGPATAILLQERVDAGEFVVVAADRTPITGGRTRSVNFLGDDAPFPVGGAMIAAVLRCPVGMITAVREGRGFHMFVARLGDFRDIRRGERSDEIGRVIDQYAGRLEKLVLRFPYQWFNFFDFWGKSARTVGEPARKSASAADGNSKPRDMSAAPGVGDVSIKQL